MSQLTKLIEFLDREDVSEVVVATGRPVTLRMGGEYRALGRSPATFAQIDALFAGSPLAELIAAGGGTSERMRLADRDCVVEVQAHAEQVLIRLGRARAGAPEPLSARRGGNSSGPIVVAAPALPRTRSRDHLMGPALAAPSQPASQPALQRPSQPAVAPASQPALQPPRQPPLQPPLQPASQPALQPPPQPPQAMSARVPTPRGAPAPVTSAGDDFGALISRSDDGGPGPVATGSSARDAGSLAPPSGTRRRSITMPPIAIGTAPVLEPVVVERSDAPMSAGPAPGRHSIELPPEPAGAPPPIVPTATATPPPRPSTLAVPTPVVAPASGPHVAPVAPAFPAPVAAPVPAPLAPPAPAPAAAATTGYAPSRRHTITAAPTVEPLPPLHGGKARATPELLAILAGARGRNASDLHLAGDRPPMERSVRGLEAAGPPLSVADVERMLSSLLTPAQRAQLDARGYVDAALDVDGAGRLRANVSRFRGGVKGSFRLVLSAPPSLEQLGLPRELARVTTYHQGLVVIAGPNGHGKTTTLAALVDLINTQKAHHILTIEDPVEILHPRKRAVITQREVGNHTRTFGAALKASLREDPDVIVIGELRDRETVEIALTAAETGHLVMATMSTPSAAKTLDRLIDMFPPDDQQQVRISLAAALKFVVAQRLVPTADGQGIAAAVELLTGVLPLAALIRDNKLFQVPSLQQRGRSFGMIRLDDSLAELVRAGRITEDAALRIADSKKDLAAALRAPAPSAVAAAAARPPEPKRGLGGLFGAGRRPE